MNNKAKLEALASTERKFGLMVLSSALTELVKRILRAKFDMWVLNYSTKANPSWGIVRRKAAICIQRWFRRVFLHGHSTLSKWGDAVKRCLQRRRVMKYMIQFEYLRKQATGKLKKGIASRRRYFFAARAIQRWYRWFLYFRKVRYRLIRSVNARKLQRWRRMFQFRTDFDKCIIRLVIRSGGYNRVFKKVPERYSSKFSKLNSIDKIISELQRSWFKYLGKLALFESFAARKKEMARMKFLNDNARLIQNCYKYHLWVLLMTAAFQNNRARRIQRGFRSYQYRSWSYNRIMMRRNRFAKVIQRTMKFFYSFIPKINARFKIRKEFLFQQSIQQQNAAWCIQRGFRCSRARALLKFKRNARAVALIRGNRHLLIDRISRIQRNFRIVYFRSRYSYHVYLLMGRLKRKERFRYNSNALCIQKVARLFVKRLREAVLKKQLVAKRVLFLLSKAFLLKNSLYYRVVATRKKKNLASSLIARNLRVCIFVKTLRVKFALRKAIIEYAQFRNFCASVIQKGLRERYEQYYMAVRVAGRRMLDKRRKREAHEAYMAMLNEKCCVVQKFFKGVVGWQKTMRLLALEKRKFIEDRASKKMQKFGRFVICNARYRTAVRLKNEAKERERIRLLHIKACNEIGWFYKRYRELQVLKIRFINRKRMLDEFKRLDLERMAASEEKRLADEEVARTEANLVNTIAASWKQGSDAQGRNYYYNFITGESRWEPPEDWRVKPVDVWLRQKDERGHVYYYNQQTLESRWLPPCAICGGNADKWCGDCNTAYCDQDFNDLHGEYADENMRVHQWSATELDKDVLLPGEVHCIECKCKRASRMCTTCWDPYCDDCFKYVHRLGALRNHKPLAYRRAKQGWMCVKGRVEGERDYYVHGTTGETTFDKPEELMTPEELILHKNFLAHKEAAEKHVEEIEKLQYDLETAAYERDSLYQEKLAAEEKARADALASKRVNKGKSAAMSRKNANEVIQSTHNAVKSKGLLSFFSSKQDVEYKQQMLITDDRSREVGRTKMIENLLKESTDFLVENKINAAKKEMKKK